MKKLIVLLLIIPIIIQTKKIDEIKEKCIFGIINKDFGIRVGWHFPQLEAEQFRECLIKEVNLEIKALNEYKQSIRDQTEEFKEKLRKAMNIKDELLREGNHSLRSHDFAEKFFNALLREGFTKEEATRYAFGTAENN